MATSHLSTQEKSEKQIKYRQFYTTALNQIQARFDFSDPFFEVCKIFIALNARKADPKLSLPYSKDFLFLKKLFGNLWPNRNEEKLLY